MIFTYKVEMASGEVLEATADQRDVALFERQTFGKGWFQARSESPFTFARFLAWSALKRDKRTNLPWDQWEEQCLQVDGVEDSPEGDAADPGRSAASAEN